VSRASRTRRRARGGSNAPPAGGDNVARLAAHHVRLEDGAVAVQVVVGGEERRDLDVFDAHLLAQREDVAQLVEALLDDVLEAGDRREHERAHLAEVTCARERESVRNGSSTRLEGGSARTDAVEGPEEVAHRPRDADELEEVGRRLAPRALQPTMLDEDLAHGLALLGGEDVDDGVEDLRVVDEVRRLAAERKRVEDLLDDVDALGLHGGHDGVRDDVERGVEDRPRLLQSRNDVSTRSMAETRASRR